MVIHLAAISYVPTCERDPKQAFEVNLDGTIHLSRALVEFSPRSVLIFPSTAQVYDHLPVKPEISKHGHPVEPKKPPRFESLTEKSPIRPQNIYAETKWLAEKALEHFWEHQGLSSVV